MTSRNFPKYIFSSLDYRIYNLDIIMADVNKNEMKVIIITGKNRILVVYNEKN